jgi:tetratricopeptide (TPR) repeat protein
MFDNLAKKRLNRLIHTNRFRFFVILYEDSNDIKSVKAYIQKHYPLENATSLDLENNDYQSLSSILYKEDYTFFYIDNFDLFLNKKNIYEGFNQRRDKLARYPINIICFYPKATQKQLYKNALKYIADLWEYRNGIIELTDSGVVKEKLQDIPLKPFSSLGGLTHKSKEEEIIRLESYLPNIESNELKTNVLEQLGRLEHDLGRYEDALTYFRQSLKISKEIGDKSGEGTTLGNIATAYHSQGDYTTALKYLEDSLKIRKEIGDKSGEGTTLNNISQIYAAQGDYTTALKYLEDSLKISKEIGDKSGEGTTLNNISQIYDAQGDYTTALKYLEDSLKISKEIGDKSGEGTTLNNISQVYKARGDYTTALKYLEASLKIRKEIGDKSGEGTTLGNIATAYHAQGDYTTALKYLEDSLKIRKEIGDTSGLCVTFFNMGHIYLQDNKMQEAIESWVTVYLLAKKIGLAQALDALENLAGQLGLKNGLEGWEKLSQQFTQQKEE